MVFNSLEFLVFLSLFFVLYWIVPHKCRWPIFLLSNCIFYMHGCVKYIFLLLATTLLSYLAALLLEITKSKKLKKFILLVALVIILGVLLFFKYLNFILHSYFDILTLVGFKIELPFFEILLPLGISFYIFKVLSYIIDIYKGKIKPETHLGYYAIYVSFFPTLLAGPIDRPDYLLDQIKNPKTFDYHQATKGLKLMAWGYFKKLVIADTLAQYVNKVYSSPKQINGFALILATVFFSIQIYCDFSGYSDIAIGTAGLLGFNLKENFKHPYFSQSIKGFWDRWHISLSSWFKDYVYIPLGGNRVCKFRCYLNIIITFLVSGLWHGANWTFVCWGALHGLAQIVENTMLGKVKDSTNGIIKWVRIFCVFVFVSFAWIFFKANSLSDSIYVITHLFNGINNPIAYLHDGFAIIGMEKYVLAKMIIFIGFLVVFDFISIKENAIDLISKKPIYIRWPIYLFLVLIIIVFSQKGVAADFVYMQF